MIKRKLTQKSAASQFRSSHTERHYYKNDTLLVIFHYHNHINNLYPTPIQVVLPYLITQDIHCHHYKHYKLTQGQHNTVSQLKRYQPIRYNIRTHFRTNHKINNPHRCLHLNLPQRSHCQYLTRFRTNHEAHNSHCHHQSKLSTELA